MPSVFPVTQVGVGLCVCLLVTQSCLTLCDPMDYSPPGSSVHGLLKARILKWVYHSLLWGIFPSQGWNLGLLHCRQIFYHLKNQGSLGAAKARQCLQQEGDSEAGQEKQSRGEDGAWCCGWSQRDPGEKLETWRLGRDQRP